MSLKSSLHVRNALIM